MSSSLERLVNTISLYNDQHSRCFITSDLKIWAHASPTKKEKCPDDKTVRTFLQFLSEEVDRAGVAGISPLRWASMSITLRRFIDASNELGTEKQNCNVAVFRTIRQHLGTIEPLKSLDVAKTKQQFTFHLNKLFNETTMTWRIANLFYVRYFQEVLTDLLRALPDLTEVSPNIFSCGEKFSTAEDFLLNALLSRAKHIGKNEVKRTLAYFYNHDQSIASLDSFKLKLILIIYGELDSQLTCPVPKDIKGFFENKSPYCPALREILELVIDKTSWTVSEELLTNKSLLLKTLNQLAPLLALQHDQFVYENYDLYKRLYEKCATDKYFSPDEFTHFLVPKITPNELEAKIKRTADLFLVAACKQTNPASFYQIVLRSYFLYSEETVINLLQEFAQPTKILSDEELIKEFSELSTAPRKTKKPAEPIHAELPAEELSEDEELIKDPETLSSPKFPVTRFKVATRVRDWRKNNPRSLQKEGYATLSHDEQEKKILCHSYPMTITQFLCQHTKPKEWQGKKHTRHYSAPGMIESYGNNPKRIEGLFTDCFDTTTDELYHHYFEETPFSDLTKRYEESGSFSKLDHIPRNPTDEEAVEYSETHNQFVITKTAFTLVVDDHAKQVKYTLCLPEKLTISSYQESD